MISLAVNQFNFYEKMILNYSKPECQPLKDRLIFYDSTKASKGIPIYDNFWTDFSTYIIVLVGSIFLVQFFRYRLTFMSVTLAVLICQYLSISNLGGSKFSSQLFNLSMIIGQSFTTIVPIYRIWTYFSYRWKVLGAMAVFFVTQSLPTIFFPKFYLGLGCQYDAVKKK